MINLETYDVTHVSEWIRVSEIPTHKNTKYHTMNEAYGTVGVYQVALTKDIEEIGSEFIHEKIGYTGKSYDVLGRTYSIRAPKGSHGASRYIRQMGYDREKEVCVRYLYSTDAKVTELENAIFDLSLKMFGHRFQWADASAGTSGKYSQMMDLASGLSSAELINAIIEFKELAIEKSQEEFRLKMQTALSS